MESVECLHQRLQEARSGAAVQSDGEVGKAFWTPIDPKLKGDARKKAKKEYDAALAEYKKAQTERQQEIRNEEKRIEPELEAIATKAGIVDTLSGPMFQQPGTQLFTVDEIRPEINRLYGHLSEKQRQELAKQLTRKYGGKPGDQKGQKVDCVQTLLSNFR